MEIPEYLPFPLYHGTSTTWEQSIRTHGLGGRNIVHEFRALDYYRRAAEIVLERRDVFRLRVDEKWVLEQLVSQLAHVSTWNWRHGGLYLTPSECLANQYAGDRRFGSELLSACYDLHEKLVGAQSSVAYGFVGEYPELMRAFCDKGRPLVIKLHHARVAGLTTECGESCNHQVLEILEGITTGESAEQWLLSFGYGLNFQCHDVYSSDCLEFTYPNLYCDWLDGGWSAP